MRENKLNSVCPFCGANKLDLTYGLETYAYEPDIPFTRVECLNSGCKFMITDYGNPDDFIDFLNKRVPEEKLRKRNEIAEKALKALQTELEKLRRNKAGV